MAYCKLILAFVIPSGITSIYPTNIYFSKSAKETLEKVWNTFKVNKKNIRAVSLSWFHTFF